MMGLAPLEEVRVLSAAARLGSDLVSRVSAELEDDFNEVVGKPHSLCPVLTNLPGGTEIPKPGLWWLVKKARAMRLERMSHVQLTRPPGYTVLRNKTRLLLAVDYERDCYVLVLKRRR